MELKKCFLPPSCRFIRLYNGNLCKIAIYGKKGETDISTCLRVLVTFLRFNITENYAVHHFFPGSLRGL